MIKNNDNSFTIQELIPQDRKTLLDPDQKVGNIVFTAAEKKHLLQTISTPGWEIIKTVYAKQRLVQIAVAGLNIAQNTESLMFYKGQSAEANYLVRQIEEAAKSLEREEEAKNKSVE